VIKQSEPLYLAIG